MEPLPHPEGRVRDRLWQGVRGAVVLALSLGVGLVALLLVPLLLVGLSVWSTDGSWEFEGRGVRCWLFIRGSRLAALGFVAPTAGAPHYSVRLAEGTFPGWRVATYRSEAAPSDVIAVYASRCRSLRFKVTEEAAQDGRGSLVCEIEPYIDVEVGVERAGDAPAVVNVKVWGDR